MGFTRFSGGAALAAVTVLALTGCGSQATTPTSSPTITIASTATTPAPSSTPTATRTLTATPGPTATATSADSGRPANQCTSIGVEVVAADGGGAAGSEYYDVLFTNTGGSSCALRGTPGVSVVGDGNGTQLGKPADRIETGVRTLTLAVGQTVAAPLKIVNIGTDGGPLDGCTVKKGDGYRIYPPHFTRAYFVADAGAVACVSGPSFMTVGPVRPRTD